MELCNHDSLNYVGVDTHSKVDGKVILNYYCRECNTGYEVVYRQIEGKLSNEE